MTAPLAFEIHRMKETPSTNIVAKDLARQTGKEGIVVIAETQTQGRGRGKKDWASPAGGLYLSVTLNAASPKHLTDLPLLAGVAVCQAVTQLLPKQFDVSVKWPNDILVGMKKVAGILCETVEGALGVVGIGINVNTGAEPLLPFMRNSFKATSFTLECGGGAFDLTKVSDMVLKKLSGIYDIYRSEGFPAVRYLWEKNCQLVGKKVEFTESPTQKQVGTLLGIDDTGALVLATPEGEKSRFYAGEITCYWPST